MSDNDRIRPPHVTGRETIADMVDGLFNAYNAARLREASRLFSERVLQPEVTIGLSLSGAMTPAGIGVSCIVPMIKAGMIDWLVSTGANLYHDIHFAMDLELRRGSPHVDDRALRERHIIRIYDVLFDYSVLEDTDLFVEEVIKQPEFQRPMGSAEFHNMLGRYMSEREKKLGLNSQSVLAAAWEAGVPVYTSSPGDSSIGMGIAAHKLFGGGLEITPSADVNETAAIVYDAKKSGGRSAVVIVGGGSPKNFMLQTEPQIQEILGLDEAGHDYFIQFTDARPDTGGLSGATPSEAVTWGKVDPEGLPNTVVCYLDSTVALPILASYALARHGARGPRRLYERRETLVKNLHNDALAAGKWKQYRAE